MNEGVGGAGKNIWCVHSFCHTAFTMTGVFKEGNRWPGTSGFWKVCCVTVNTLNPQAGLAWLSPPRADGPSRWASEPFARSGLQASARCSPSHIPVAF